MENGAVVEDADVVAALVEHLAAVENVAEELRNEGDCRHRYWSRIDVWYPRESDDARRTCADCHWEADEFIWECDYCHTRACSRCRGDYR